MLDLSCRIIISVNGGILHVCSHVFLSDHIHTTACYGCSIYLLRYRYTFVLGRNIVVCGVLKGHISTKVIALISSIIFASLDFLYCVLRSVVLWHNWYVPTIKYHLVHGLAKYAIIGSFTCSFSLAH